MADSRLWPVALRDLLWTQGPLEYGHRGEHSSLTEPLSL
jgi:hypothetical protein